MQATVRLFMLLLTCGAGMVAKSQPQGSYTFQYDDTVLRKDYLDQTLSKKKSVLASIGKENSDDYKKVYNQQYNEIAELWKSDRTVTSKNEHSYLQAIVQKIISANRELSGTDARIVFSRDWWPNAFSMGDGTITINAGLMVFLESEAQLVFVICHELAHYYLDHNNKAIKKFVARINSDEVRQELKRLSKEQYLVNQQFQKLLKSVVFDSRHHSRDNEAEADRYAFLFMKRTGYDCNAIRSTLELLNRVDDSLLFKPLEVDKVLNVTDYPFREKWIKKESAIFSQLDEKDSPLTKKEIDSLKTHPDCEKRIALLDDSLKSVSKGAGFLVNENLFKQLKKDFFIEMSEQCYNINYISRNLYYSLQMLQAGENVQLAIYSIARDLNRIYEKQRDHTLGLTVDSETRGYPDDYNLLLRMLSRIRLEEIALLNYYFCLQHDGKMKGHEGFEIELNKARRYKN
jgi:Zn-dependent protease with chaperone function